MKFVTVRRMRRTLLPLLGLSALSVLAASGCSDSPAAPTPTPTGPAVRSISPSTGTTFGGTAVTITGQRFAAGATVTIGGAPATNVVVEDASTVKATTPAHAAGSVEVIVTQSNGASTLPQAFAFVAPSATNTPPVITSLTAQGTKSNKPAAFADLDEEIAVTA
ncbi:MAG TPA: IPT/TIG domain-containing protein, partial [Candidatus Limnocylindrales bacterium]